MSSFQKKESTGDIQRKVENDCYLDKKRAAEYLCWSISKLESNMKHLPVYKHGRGKVYFKKSELNAFMQAFRVEPSEKTVAQLAREILDQIRVKSHP